jgi:hypothetical protein
MADTPINPDREQQRRDNIVSREQSGLEPRPEDLEGLEARDNREGREVRDERNDQDAAESGGAPGVARLDDGEGDREGDAGGRD